VATGRSGLELKTAVVGCQPTKMEQMIEPMMECLLAIMADIKSSQEWMIAKIDAHQERMEVSMNA
jgi:hypothetical protein